MSSAGRSEKKVFGSSGGRSAGRSESPMPSGKKVPLSPGRSGDSRGGRSSAASEAASSSGRSAGLSSDGRSASLNGRSAMSSSAGGRSSKGKGEEVAKKKSGEADLLTVPKRRGDKGKVVDKSPNPSVAEGTVYAQIPRLKETAPEEQGEVLRRKLKECRIVYDFKQEDEFVKEKEGKRLTLLEIVEHAGQKENAFADASLIEEAVSMAGANMFRTLTPREHFALDLLDAEGEEPVLDPVWAHLEPVYELLLKLVNSKDREASVGKFVNSKFMKQVLNMFETDDPRERDCLKSLLKSMYSKFSSLRSSIRRGIQHVCLKATQEGVVQNGIAELLEILAKIINGFSMPIKDDNRDVLLKVLIPMHKIEWVHQFHASLVDCLKRFTDKDTKLTYYVVTAMLRYWPYSCGSKQILFLVELEDMLNVMPTSEFRKVNASLSRQLASCLSCPNSDVAEKALALWRNDRVVKLISKDCRDQWPIVISALYRNMHHWHDPTHKRTVEVLKSLMEADSELFDASSSKHRKWAEEQEKQDAIREQKWATLQTMHDRKSKVRVPRKVLVDGRATEKDGLLSPRSSMLSPRSSRQGGSPDANGTEAAGDKNLWSDNDDPPSPDPASPSRENSTLRQWSRGITPKQANGKYKDEMLLGHERYGMAISWPSSASDAAGQDTTLGLQALAVDNRGRIMDAVHDQNVVGQAMVLRAKREEVDACKGSIIWFSLPRLPERVAALFFVVVAPGGKLSESGCKVRMVEEVEHHEVAKFDFSKASGDACAVACVKRSKLDDPSQRSSSTEPTTNKSGETCWMLVRIEEYVKSGRHFMDMVHPFFTKLIGEVVPSVPKRMKACVALSSLAEGGVACMPQPSAAKWLFVGLGWDQAPEVVQDPSATGFAVAAVFFDDLGRSLGCVSADNPEEHGSRHSGGSTLGAGSIIDLAAVPADVTNIIFAGHLPPEGSLKVSSVASVQSPHLAVVDPAGGELARYSFDHKGAQGGGLAVARLLRDRNHGRWSFQVLAVPCAGSNWRESLTDLATISLTPLHEYQLAPQASWETCQRAVISL